MTQPISRRSAAIAGEITRHSPVNAGPPFGAVPVPAPVGKAGWRAHADAVARRCPPALRRNHAKMLEEQICALVEAIGAATVALYSPIGAEVDSRPLANALLVAGCRLAYPRLLDGDGLMEMGAADGPSALQQRPRSRLMEPIGPAVPLSAIDVCVVPALAVDGGLHRLGRNGGYYDRYLAGRSQDCVVVLVALAQCVVPWSPVQGHDQAGDLVLTEHGLFSRGAA